MDRSMEERLARYRQLRAVQMDLHSTLMEQLPQNALRECGKTLGVFKDDILVLGSESEMAVLMDYSIYDYRWDGLNVIERYINQTHLEVGSDQRILLDAMLEARYSLFVVDEIEKGAGVQTRDLFRGDGGFIMDIGMSETGVKNLVFASRVITPRDSGFSMTTGAMLPADRSIMAKIISEIPGRFGETRTDIARLSSHKLAEFSASIIRIFLEGNASSGIAFRDSTTEEIAKIKPKIGRNEPCPCGSGKKYKKCCGLKN